MREPREAVFTSDVTYTGAIDPLDLIELRQVLGISGVDLRMESGRRLFVYFLYLLAKLVASPHRTKSSVCVYSSGISVCNRVRGGVCATSRSVGKNWFKRLRGLDSHSVVVVDYNRAILLPILLRWSMSLKKVRCGMYMIFALCQFPLF